MAHSQNYDFDKYFAADDAAIPPHDEFMESIDPHIVDDSIQMPEKYIFQHAMVESSEKVVESEISKMLRMAPGILPPIDRFPKSYEPPKAKKLPDFIPADKRNKIPILLNENFFKFQQDDDDNDENKIVNKSVCGIMNNLDCVGSSNEKIAHRNNRNIQTRAKGIDSSGSNRTHQSIEVLEKYFYTVFCDDSSDEDNCNVDQQC